MHAFIFYCAYPSEITFADNEFYLLRQGCKKHKFLSVINEEKAKKKAKKKGNMQNAV